MSSVGTPLPLNLARLFRSLDGLVTSPIMQFVRGPATLVRLSATGASIVKRLARFRPIEVHLDSDLVLTSHFRLPSEAARHAEDAARLHLVSESPFQPDELVVATTIRPTEDSPAELDVRVDAFPLSALREGLGAAGLRAQNVRVLFPAKAAGSAVPIHFPLGSRRRRLIRVLLGCLPLLLAAGAMGHVSWRDVEDMRARQRQAQQFQAGLVTNLHKLETQLQAARDSQASNAAYDKLLAAAPSAFMLINDLKRTLPIDATTVSLSIKDGTLTVHTRSADILETVSALKATKVWQVTVDGTIASDASTATEVGALALRTR